MNIENIQNQVALHCGVTVAEMLGSSREERIDKARKVAMYISRKYTTQSLPAIARAFGKTHATVIHACKTVEGRISKDAKLAAEIKEFLDAFMTTQTAPECSVSPSTEELIRFSWSAGKERTVCIHGDSKRVAVQVTSKAGVTDVNVICK